MLRKRPTQRSLYGGTRWHAVVWSFKATPILGCAAHSSLKTNKRTFFASTSIYFRPVNSGKPNASILPVRHGARCCAVVCESVFSQPRIQYRTNIGSCGVARSKASPKNFAGLGASKESPSGEEKNSVFLTNNQATEQSSAPANGKKSSTSSVESISKPTSSLSAQEEANPRLGTSQPFPEATILSLPINWAPHSSRTQRLFASWQQGLVASLGAVMGIGFVIFLLYAPVKEDTVHHTAVVASEALGDLRLKARAVELSKDVVDNVLNDPKTLQLVVGIAVKLLTQEDTKIAVSSLLQSLFEDHYTQEITKKFVLKILRDPWIMEQIHVIAKEHALKIMRTKEVKEALTKLFTESTEKMLQNPELQHDAARAIRKSFFQAINPLQ